MKDEQLIKTLIKQGESEQLEFKELVRKEDIAKSLCAFLNANGGILLMGVQDDGKVIGVNDTERYEAELKSYLVQSIIPEAPITITTETIGTKKVLLAKVWNGSKPPYVFEGIIYYRKGVHTTKATPNDVSKLIIERQKTELHWERQPALGIDLDDLDELEIRKTLKDLAQFQRGKVFTEKEIEEFLTYYGLYQNGNLTNAAVVLFAKEPTRYLPQCRIRITVFKGTKSADSYIHDRVLEGNLFRNIDEILQFFEVNIATKSKFSDKKWLREDKTYPKLALREGLMNAIIHRDYSSVSGTVHVAFYPSHLEITNSGELFGNYKPIDLTKNHLSVPRNPDIAHICFLRQMIEKIGRGTVLMIEDCEQKGYPKPKWESKLGATTLTFPDITVTAKTDDAVNDAVNDTVNDAVNDAVKRGVIDAVSDAVSDALTKAIKAMVANDNGVSINDVMDKTGKSNATVKRYLQTLKELELVEFRGAAKTGKYFVKPKALAKIKKSS
jgi:ATP-dependent DNA helicase RecG